MTDTFLSTLRRNSKQNSLFNIPIAFLVIFKEIKFRFYVKKGTVIQKKMCGFLLLKDQRLLLTGNKIH